jgi:hypothetical protein
MIRVADLRSRTLCIHGNGSTLFSVEEIVYAASEAEELDKAFEAWSADIPQAWKFSSCTYPEPFEASNGVPLFNNTAYIYTNYGHATVWNRYHAVRLVVNGIYLRLLSALSVITPEDPSVEARKARCQEVIDAATNHICSTVPFFFNFRSHAAEENADEGLTTTILPQVAVLLAWPIVVAISTEAVSEDPRNWLRSRLKTVASAIGEGLKESLVETTEFKF